jgi:hypothetical protein
MTVAELHEVLHRDLGPELAARVILTLVRAAHGETIYVGARIRPEVGPTDTPRSLQQRWGVSRPTAYRWLSRYRAGLPENPANLSHPDLKARHPGA